MAINNEPTIQPRTVTGIFTNYIAKVLPLAFDDSMSYYECLCALLKYINDTIVPANNENAAAIAELQHIVETYLDDETLQPLINNKLDEMAEDGTLEQIIEQFVNSSAMWGYDTVADMKSATNLIDGSYAKTLGYYEKNDGGMATYKIRQITNDDVVDEMFIIALSDDNLIAELIIGDRIVPQMAGARANSSYDDAQVLAKVFTKASVTGTAIQLKGRYWIKTPLLITTNGPIVVYGSKANISQTGSSENNSFSNITFTADGYIEINGVTNITFQNICFNGPANGIILKSFRNRIINCSFNGFTNAIKVEHGTHWNGENKITDCVFNTVTNCIVLNNGSDGDITGNLVDSTCTSFISGGYDAGYKIENNHDYSQNGSRIAGYNTVIVGNYIDGFNKLEITGNSGFTITGNTFIGNTPVSGTNYAIKFSNTTGTITSGVITGNNVAIENNNTVNEYLFFIDITDINYFSYVTVSGNNIKVCKALFSGATPTKISYSIIEQTTHVKAMSINNKATVSSYQGTYSNSVAICHAVLTLDTLSTKTVLRWDNVASYWIHYIKMNNSDTIYTIWTNSRDVDAQGSWAQATGMEVWSIGVRNMPNVPVIF